MAVRLHPDERPHQVECGWGGRAGPAKISGGRGSRMRCRAEEGGARAGPSGGGAFVPRMWALARQPTLLTDRCLSPAPCPRVVQPWVPAERWRRRGSQRQQRCWRRGRSGSRACWQAPATTATARRCPACMPADVLVLAYASAADQSTAGGAGQLCRPAGARVGTCRSTSGRALDRSVLARVSTRCTVGQPVVPWPHGMPALPAVPAADDKTAGFLVGNAQAVLAEYGGDLNRLRDEAGHHPGQASRRRCRLCRAQRAQHATAPLHGV